MQPGNREGREAFPVKGRLTSAAWPQGLPVLETRAGAGSLALAAMALGEQLVGLSRPHGVLRERRGEPGLADIRVSRTAGSPRAFRACVPSGSREWLYLGICTLLGPEDASESGRWRCGRSRGWGRQAAAGRLERGRGACGRRSGPPGRCLGRAGGWRGRRGRGRGGGAVTAGRSREASLRARGYC